MATVTAVDAATLPRTGGVRATVQLAVALAALAVAVVAGVMIGPLPIPVSGIVRSLVDALPLISLDSGLTEQQEQVVWQMRLPRVVLAGMVGGILALGGGTYQAAFRNPLADPYLLGVAAGAGLGATVAIVWFRSVSIGSVGAVPVLAFAGACLAVAAAMLVGRSMGEGRSATTLILGGVAVASFFTALQTFIQQSHSETVREVYDWILGRLATDGWTEVRLFAPYALVCAVVVLAHGRLLDVIGLGDTAAGWLGVNAGRVRLVVVLAVTLGTAGAVAVSGLIGFVGIIVPHVMRLAGVRGNRLLLPMAMLVGAGFLIACDIVARAALEPAELPIGVVTAVIGAPVFALVLRSSRGGGGT